MRSLGIITLAVLLGGLLEDYVLVFIMQFRAKRQRSKQIELLKQNAARLRAEKTKS